VLEAARTMPREAFEEKVEKEHPHQHLQVHRALSFRPDRSGAKVIEAAIAWALEHDIAGTREEALVRACETALNQWELDFELSQMPVDVS
jgi:aryl-alcohol dehydrogenase-like predicted oxidoreductase